MIDDTTIKIHIYIIGQFKKKKKVNNLFCLLFIIVIEKLGEIQFSRSNGI